MLWVQKGGATLWVVVVLLLRSVDGVQILQQPLAVGRLGGYAIPIRW